MENKGQKTGVENTGRKMKERKKQEKKMKEEKMQEMKEQKMKERKMKEITKIILSSAFSPLSCFNKIEIENSSFFVMDLRCSRLTSTIYALY